ncbi:MAG: TonB family protein [Alistipes sp.]|nr:TonB family protein [Alistipes sp.]
MFGFITYLAQSALCLVALYIIYKATMSHETLHRLNRVTLLAMVVLSAVLPMCRIKIVQEVETVLTPIVDDMSATAVAVDAAPETIDYRPIMEDALVVIFLLGAAFMVVRLAMSWLSVWRVVRSGEHEELGEGVRLTVVEKLSSPFSWFRHVVVSRADMDENRDMILEHELAHVRFGHSWDVLFVDLTLIVWWFNPAMWLLRRELQSLHEYQADDAVLNRGIDAKTYQLLLIKRAVGSRLHSVANCLNHSNLKNRITMMCRKQSSKWQSAKLLLVLPMVAISLSAFATTVYVETKSDDKVNQLSLDNQDSDPTKAKFYAEQVEKIEEQMKFFDEMKSEYEAVMKEFEARKDEFEKNDKKAYVEMQKQFTEMQKQFTEMQKHYGELDSVRAKRMAQIKEYSKNGSANIRLEGGKIYLDGKLTSAEKLEKYFAENKKLINIKVADDKSGEALAKVRGLARQNQILTINYEQVRFLPAEDSEMQKPQDQAEEKVEKMPTFQGGDLQKFALWVYQSMKYPQEAVDKKIQGRVIVEFVVAKDGTVSSTKVLNNAPEILSAEAERVIKSSPKWEAGEHKGKKVNVKFVIPVVFKVTK